MKRGIFSLLLCCIATLYATSAVYARSLSIDSMHVDAKVNLDASVDISARNHHQVYLVYRC
jgi:hypothetical protein